VAAGSLHAELEERMNENPWHLFLVEDGNQHRLISAQSESVGKAHELVTSAAIIEHDYHPDATIVTYLGIAHSGDVDMPVGPQP
jgi:hypothetical protein